MGCQSCLGNLAQEAINSQSGAVAPFSKHELDSHSLVLASTLASTKISCLKTCFIFFPVKRVFQS